MRFTCPHCQQHLVGEDELGGQVIHCPSCNKRMTVPPKLVAKGEPGAETKSGTSSTGSSRKSSALAEVDGTNVNILVSGLIGLGLTVVFYLLLVLLFNESYVYGLFMERGWVPFCEAFLFWWSISFLYFKWKKISEQSRCMLFDVLPDDLGDDITDSNVERFIKHVRLLPGKADSSFLIARVLRGLDHFRIRNSNPEVATVLSLQSDIDANTMQSSYTLVKTFIWAIPILGFIGTVQGLGSAVGGFGAGLDQATDISVIKDSLTSITVGLAVAFDTTLVALVMSVILMFPMSSMQKSEEDVLSRIDDYCADHLLKRLRERHAGGDGDGSGPAGPLEPGALRQALEEATRVQTDALRGWSDRLESVGERLANTTENSLNRLTEQNSSSQYIVAAAVHKANEELCHYFKNLKDGVASLQAAVSELEKKGVKLDQPARRWGFARRRKP